MLFVLVIHASIFGTDDPDISPPAKSKVEIHISAVSTHPPERDIHYVPNDKIIGKTVTMMMVVVLRIKMMASTGGLQLNVA
jgi:hypothetical protein